jgi:hypothetical protein
MISKQQWQTVIQQAITSYNPALDVEFGPIFDGVVKPVAQVLELLDRRYEYIKSILDLSEWESWSTADLDSIAGNYGLARRGGTKANGVLTFYTTIRPSGNIVVAENTTVMTASGIKFRTTTEISVALVDIGLYKNAVTGRYEFPCTVEAYNSGTTGNVSAGSITRLSNTITGITNCVNKQALTGGAETESNEMLVNRIKFAIQGGRGLTASAIKLNLLQNFSAISDIAVESALPLIDGTVDIFYKGTRTVETEDNTYWFGGDIILKKTPVLDVISVISGVTEFVREVDWTFVRDTSSAFARTNVARDRIVWLGEATPAYGGAVDITYLYNALADDISAWERTNENRILGTELIYREALAQGIELTANVRLYQGYGSSVLVQIQDYITSWVASLGINGSLEQSDLQFNLRKDIAGIDNFVITKLCLKGGSGISDLIIDKSGYFQIQEAEDIVLTQIL